MSDGAVYINIHTMSFNWKGEGSNWPESVLCREVIPLASISSLTHPWDKDNGSKSNLSLSCEMRFGYGVLGILGKHLVETVVFLIINLLRTTQQDKDKGNDSEQKIDLYKDKDATTLEDKGHGSDCLPP